MEKLSFRLNITPPTITAQEKKAAYIGGHIMFYDPPKLKTAKALLIENLKEFAPEKPIEGAIALYCKWDFEAKSHKAGTYRITKPDTDNIQKALKDCMTKTGFWKDDAQVAREYCEKKWERIPGISICVEKLKEGGEEE